MMPPRGLRIRTKLFAMLSAAGVVTMLGGFYGSYGSWQTLRHFREEVMRDEQDVRNLLELKSAVSLVEARALGLELSSAHASVAEGTSDATKKYELLSSVEQVERWVHAYSEDDDGQTTVWAVADNTNQVVVKALDLAHLRERGAARAELVDVETALDAAQQNLRVALAEATAREDAELRETLRQADVVSRRAVWVQLVAILVAGVTGIVLAATVASSIAKPLASLRRAAVAIANGDVGQRAIRHADDEVGGLTDAFNGLASWLQDEIGRRRSEETKLRLLLEMAPFGVMTVGSDGRIVLANRALERMLEYGAGDLWGRSAADILPASLLDGANATSVQAQAVAHSGIEAPVEASVTPVVLEGERVTMVTVVDLRERQRIEGQLRQAEKLSAVGQLAAGVAHEINNPLTVILGFAQGMQRRTGPTDPNRNPLAAIVRETARCRELVQSLLNFSRAGGNEAVAIDVNAAVGVATGLVAGHARLRCGEIRQDLGPQLPPILGNRNELEQALVNLLKNALDALDGSGTVTVSTRRTDLDGRPAVEIAVVDTGTGMSPETQARIFEPFFTTKEVGRGTGLGLALVFEMVSRHKGTIDVASKLGEGSTFRVQLLAA
jgi:PAS domain S-box-containing protein